MASTQSLRNEERQLPLHSTQWEQESQTRTPVLMEKGKKLPDYYSCNARSGCTESAFPETGDPGDWNPTFRSGGVDPMV